MSCESDRCSGVGDVRFSDKSLGGVHRLAFELLKNGVAWTGIDSVELTLKRPATAVLDGLDEEVGPFALVLETPDAGVWYYDTTPDDLDVVGYWTASIEVTDGAIVQEWPHEVAFRVVNR